MLFIFGKGESGPPSESAPILLADQITILGMKWVFKHQVSNMFGFKLNKRE